MSSIKTSLRLPEPLFKKENREFEEEKSIDLFETSFESKKNLIKENTQLSEKGKNPLMDEVKDKDTQIEAEKRAQIENLLKELEKQIQLQKEGLKEKAEAEDFHIPKGLEFLFAAPLNRKLLERNFSILNRLLSISGQIFSLTALQYQGINRIAGGVALVSSTLLLKYLPVAFNVGVGFFSAYSALANTLTSVLGSDSLKERREIWNEASKETTFFKKLAHRVQIITGSDSLKSRAISLVKAVFQTFIAKIGYDYLYEIEDSLLTKYPIALFEFIGGTSLPLFTGYVAGGIAWFGITSATMNNGAGYRAVNDEMTQAYEDWIFKDEYDRLLKITADQYRHELAGAMGLEKYEDLEALRASYRKDVGLQIEHRNYPEKNQIEINALKALRAIDPKDPERALKPVLAQLVVLQKKKIEMIKLYEGLIEKNLLQDAHKLLNESLKSTLYQIEFLKQAILDPQRPPMGILSPDGSHYFSLMSIPAGSEIKWEMKATSPILVEAEAKDFFLNEAAIQKILCHSRGKKKVLELQRQREALILERSINPANAFKDERSKASQLPVNEVSVDDQELLESPIESPRELTKDSVFNDSEPEEISIEK